jgi:predicted O-methyltransferase YrrM
MAAKTLELSPELYDYLLSISYQETPSMEALRAETAKLPLGHMQISPEQAQLMSFLVRLLHVRKALEIGVFTGFSALCVAEAMPPEGRLIACDTSEEWTNIAKTYWQKSQVANKIDLRLAPAEKTLDQLLSQGEQSSFDFAFIDADKENYPLYYEKTLQLLRKGGVIMLDNMFQHGKVLDSHTRSPSVKAIQSLNKALYQDARVSISVLPISDGITLVHKL